MHLKRTICVEFVTILSKIVQILWRKHSMKNSQLTEILRSFDKTEFREFEKFVKSPYFNNRSEIIRYLYSIKKFHPKFDSGSLKEENIFKHVYPGKKYNPVLMRKLNSLTMNLIMDFIAVKGFRENKFEYNIKLFDKLRERKLPELFEKKSNKFNEILANSKHDIYYYEYKLKHTSILNGHLLNTNEKSMVSKLQNELDELIEYFLVAALLQYIRLGEWSRIINKKFDQKFLDEVLNYFSSRKKGEITLSYLYYNMLMLMNTEEEKYYNELINSRNKFESRLSKMDDYNISIVSMQYCHKRVMKGDEEFRKEQFEITKQVLDKDLIPAGFIEPYFFTNTVRNASGLNEFEWSESFIERYKNMLNPDISREIIDYSFAMIESGRGNFELSLNHLSKINIERSNMKIEIKNLLIIIYYELKYLEELVSLIDTYKHFLQREKSITEKIRKLNSLFLKFVSDLVKIYHNGKYDDAKILKKEIDKASYFNLKDWLSKKADELINQLR